MIAVIDYGIGNLGSVANALIKLGKEFQISGDLDVVQKAEMLILPGVGAAGKGMENLENRNLDRFLTEEIKRGKPFLGICLGMQLLFEKSEEGNVNCLGLLKGKVKKFKRERKVPQIGWNKVEIQQCSNATMKQLFKNIPDESYFYFVNSYYCIPQDNSIIAGATEYGEKFASLIVKNNIIATQFHPEKSGVLGFKLLKNIINIFSHNSL